MFRKISRRLFFIPLLAAMLLTLTVACGNGASDQGGEAATVHVFQFKVDTMDQMQHLANVFAEQYEDKDLTIIVETIGGTGDFAGALAARFAANDIPDLIALNGAPLAELYMEHLVDLTNEPWVPYTVPGLLDMVTFNGRLFGQPLTIEAFGYIYNVDLFEQAGITQPPTTLSELLYVAERLDDAGIRAFSNGYAEFWVLALHFLNGALLADLGFDTVGRLGAEDSLANHRQLVNEMVNLLQLTTRFGGNEASLATDYNTSVNDFAMGRAAIIQQGTWIQPTLDELNPNMRVGIFGFLTNDGSNTGRIPVGNAGYWAIHNGSESVDAMRDFLTFMATDEYAINSKINDFMFIPAFVGTDYDLSTLGSIFAALQPHIENYNTSEWLWDILPVGSGAVLSAPMQQAAIGLLSIDELIAEMDSLIAGLR